MNLCCDFIKVTKDGLQIDGLEINEFSRLCFSFGIYRSRTTPLPTLDVCNKLRSYDI